VYKQTHNKLHPEDPIPITKGDMKRAATLAATAFIPVSIGLAGGAALSIGGAALAGHGLAAATHFALGTLHGIALKTAVLSGGFGWGLPHARAAYHVFHHQHESESISPEEISIAQKFLEHIADHIEHMPFSKDEIATNMHRVSETVRQLLAEAGSAPPAVESLQRPRWNGRSRHILAAC